MTITYFDPKTARGSVDCEKCLRARFRYMGEVCTLIGNGSTARFFFACLTLTGALPVFPSTYPGTPSPPILESPVCSTGNESSLLDCPASGSALGSISRSASISIVGVKCDGEFRHT